MTLIVALVCPVCGAPLSADMDRCNFCGSYVVIKTHMPRLSRSALNQSLIQDHIDDFRSRTRSSRYDVEAHYGLGLAYYSLGLVNDSIDELTEAARLTPENPHIQAQLAIVLQESFRAGNAAAKRQMKERLDTALLLDPEHLEANTLKMQVLLDADRLKEAVLQYESMPVAVQRQTSTILATSLENQGQHRLQSGNWEGAAWCWKSLGSLDDAAAKRLQIQFLRMHQRLVPASFKSQTRDSAQASPAQPKGILATLLAAGVGLFVGFLQLIMVALIVARDQNSTMSSGGAVLSVVSLALFAAAPVIAAVWYRSRRRVTVTGVESGQNAARKKKYSRDEILAGSVDTETLQQVADLVVNMARSEELWRTQKQSAKRK